jgi:catechol 2,3-dioxygenase-like lactoylglutathione lyase family enzyme
VIKGIDHVAVVTTDVERAAKFYTEALGFREKFRLETSHSGTLVFLGLGGTLVELFGGGKPKAAGDTGEVGYRHICLLVDDADAEYERLKALGVEFTMEPATVESGLRIAFFTDPDGSPIEIMQRPK